MKTHYISFQTGGRPTGGGAKPQGLFSGVPFLGPGMFLLVLGLITLLAPQLVLAVIAAFFLAIGAVLLFLGYKFFQLKKRLEKDIQKVQMMDAKSFEAGQFQESVRQNFRSGFQEFSTQSSDADVTEFEIDGETIEVVDADEESSSEKKSRIIYH